MKHLFGPLKAVLITDLHFSGHLSSDYYDNLADVIKKLNPDILFLGGDHIHSLEYLKGLKGFLLKTASYDYKLGKYAVLGNHDFAHGPLQVRQALKESGFICLGGKNRIIKNRDKKFVLKGNEGPWGMDAPGHELPGIALCHTIDNMHNFAKNNVHLALAGHFHDGQIKIPFFGPLLIPSVHGRAFSKGSFNFEGTRIAVSSGAGLSGPKFRISSQPEVVFINIK
jgi:predicted MPP superfamily phosphohydrolase